jgi:hypothetical protein
MFADYFLQTARMLSGRSDYMHIGRAQHAAIHAVGSAIAFVLIGASAAFILVIVAIEWVVHFHIDWAKARYSDTHDLTPAQARFWQATGLDQALHQLTYVAMVWAWVMFAAT